MASYAGLRCDRIGGGRCMEDGTTNAKQLCLVVYGDNNYRVMCLGCLRSIREEYAGDNVAVFSIGENMTAVAFNG